MTEVQLRADVPAWRIKSWSREEGLGTVECDHLDDLPFDSSCAEVDDFEVGEPVHIRLERSRGSRVVTRVWPDDPRLPGGLSGFPAVPSLSSGLEQSIARSLQRLPDTFHHRIISLEHDLLVYGEDGVEGIDHEVAIRFVDVQYLELPLFWGAKSMRLANSNERSYVGSKIDAEERTVVVKIVDDERRVFFVACGGIEISVPREDGPRVRADP